MMRTKSHSLLAFVVPPLEGFGWKEEAIFLIDTTNTKTPRPIKTAAPTKRPMVGKASICINRESPL